MKNYQSHLKLNDSMNYFQRKKSVKHQKQQGNKQVLH